MGSYLSKFELYVIGCDNLPDFPILWSDHPNISATVCLEKKRGSALIFEYSSEIAFAPFSQYSDSRALLSSGSGQAQPGQSNPPF